MIAKRSRLSRPAFKGGWRTSVAGPYFTLKIKKNPENKKRIGVVVGVAVEKSAARRNFWKRQAKAVLTSIKTPAEDILLILSPKTRTLTRKKFQTELSRAVARIA